MRLRTKRQIDHALGSPLLYLLILPMMLSKLVRRRPKGEPRRILILKFQGLGSLVLARPAILGLRERFRDARILFWGTPPTASLARLCPEIDEILVLDDTSPGRALWSILRCLVSLWRRPPDWAFDFEVYSKLSTVLLVLSMARRRVGFAVNTVIPRKYLLSYLVFFNRHTYLGDAYRHLVSLLVPGLAETPRPARLSWTPEAGRRRVEGRYVVLNPHCGPLATERRWPRASFAGLVTRLAEADPSLTFVVVGNGDDELVESRKLIALFPRHARAIDLTNRLSLRELIDVLERAALVVTGDTAALHLALSAGAPTAALFGPTHPRNFVPPDRANVRTFTESLYCSPCVHNWETAPCHGDNQCMKRIAIEPVLAACLTLLGRPASEARVPQDVKPEPPVPRLRAHFLPGLVHAS